MKNFSVKINNKEYWISRSIATVTFIFKELNNKIYVLIEKRGQGIDDEQGKWCSVCGYLDYDETIEESAKRECKEETGFVIDTNRLQFMKINSSPSENRQNVTVHYMYWANKTEDYDKSKSGGGEENEVEKVEWFEVGNLSKDKNTLYVNTYDIMEREWAFEHDIRIIEYLSTKYKLDYGKNKKE